MRRFCTDRNPVRLDPARLTLRIPHLTETLVAATAESPAIPGPPAGQTDVPRFFLWCFLRLIPRHPQLSSFQLFP